MVSWQGDELDLTGFVQSFDTNVVLVVEISSIQWKDVAFFVKRLEPSSFFWIRNGILIEFDKHGSVDFSEFRSSSFVVIAKPSILLFVVEGWQESAV